MIEIHKTCTECHNVYVSPYEPAAQFGFDGVCSRCSAKTYQISTELTDQLDQLKISCHSEACRCCCHEPLGDGFWRFGYIHPQGCTLCTDGYVRTMAKALDAINEDGSPKDLAKIL